MQDDFARSRRRIEVEEWVNVRSIRDAHGVEIEDPDMIWIDLETGDGERIVLDANGKVVIVEANEGLEAKREAFVYAAPIAVEWNEEPGYRYLLQSFEPGPAQELLFIQKEERDGQFVTVRNGTTNEEVLRVLLDRLQFLQAKAPCIENEMAILSLQSCGAWLEERTRNRRARGVEGTPAS